MTSDPRIPRATTAPPAATPLSKADLRKHLLGIRRTLDAATRAAWDAAIGRHVLAWSEAAAVDALGVYWPLRDEPNLQAAYGELARRGVRLLLPVVVEKHAPLAFADWRIGEAMVKDGMGVAVPADLRLAPRPAALLVPCLGYNGHGYRLGYGGGFYDRTLAAQPRPRTVGVAYACQQADFGDDPHDIALERIVTELGTATPGA
ncbi:5-formyltetrahydrofolate cyclo-ligase [Rugamonas apoptosis]|uniref:5-formyltetrahydrofolate cyclo-ligase n=1 Tax=Rugamonas apoptosis TaxID=2758570 RepID=A0A7W2F5U9_9BURK|nr:5-formyltetrahydrofolate cyclo-ligase [Rugamonas apoptosis]MBA5685673.1 5-formyltetrahydrofolate cyclo-ligase [Rugamonas apoptosis]